MITSAKEDRQIDSQANVIAFLGNGGLNDGKPKRIDTHIASIFLTPGRAWKIKRAVRFGYLDFTTADKRKAALEEELRLNRRTAPDLYIAIHAITGDTTGRLTIDGDGNAVDWVLEMRRFPDGALLSDRADAGLLTPPVILQLADEIQAFHSSTDISLTANGGVAFRNVVEGNISSMESFPDILAPHEVEALAAKQRVLSTQFMPLLNARGKAGRIRHGHGDLHLGNIALIDDEPTLFDCLEFSAELATVDVLYDLSFLLMDLWQRGLRNEANMVFNRYLDLSPEDENAVALMPLFLSVRAAIRSHVMAAQSMRNGGDMKLAERARTYLRLSADFLDPAPPHLVAIGGLSGTGKSTLARSIAHLIGAPPGARILRSDVLRKRIAGVPPETRLTSEHYSRSQGRKVYHLLETLAADALAQNHAVIADAVFADKAERATIESVANVANVPFDGLWLEASESDRAERIAARPTDASDADVALVRVQAAFDIGELGGWRSLSVSGSLQETVAAAISALAIK